MVTVMPSHHNLPEIFYYLWERGLATRGSFVDQIFRLVLFHHSIEIMDSHPNKVNLSKSELDRYCDDQFHRLCQILQLADNEAYILFDETHVQRCRRKVLAKSISSDSVGLLRDT
jgi:hypothetical protein